MISATITDVIYLTTTMVILAGLVYVIVRPQMTMQRAVHTAIISLIIFGIVAGGYFIFSTLHPAHQSPSSSIKKTRADVSAILLHQCTQHRVLFYQLPAWFAPHVLGTDHSKPFIIRNRKTLNDKIQSSKNPVCIITPSHNQNRFKTKWSQFEYMVKVVPITIAGRGPEK